DGPRGPRLPAGAPSGPVAAPAGPVLQPRRPYQVKFPLFHAGEQKSLTFVHRRVMLSAREGERSMRVSKAPEVRRQEILETAMKLFTEKGYEETSMRDIAQAC